MDLRTLNVLEYDKIKDLIKKFTTSVLTLERISKMELSTSKEEIFTWQTETSEAQSIILQSGSFEIGANYDIKAYLKNAESGFMLDPGSLLKIAASLKTARRLKTKLTTRKDTPLLSSYASELAAYSEIENEIFNAIVSEDEISDEASSELKRIRKAIANCKENIRTKLNSIVQKNSDSKYLQDSIVTIRDDRFVVPVKSANKDKVAGIVHDTSASGATLFVEPMAVVEMNNNLRRLYGDEKREIERILFGLTEKVAKIAETVKYNQERITDLDFIFCKGYLSVSMKADQPKLSDSFSLKLKQARHPLINPKTVVSSDIEIGEDYKTLVITGPNTGGKTVTLKTVGLFSLMFQSGLHIPCDYGSKMCIFDNIFADIGDEQSIEQSLSTFSSHMKHIVDILDKIHGRSLVLFDELGAGTDPVEGAALAVSILEKVKKSDSLCIATTHYSELKLYALNTPNVENASMEFDIDTLSPTYNLITGIPGKSNAFEISKRLGLSEEVIADAKRRIDKDEIQFEEILRDLNAEKVRMAKNREETELKLQNIAEMEKRIAQKENSLDRKKDEFINESKRQARSLIKEAKAESEKILEEIKKLRSVTEEKEYNRSVESIRKNLKTSENKYAEKERLFEPVKTDYNLHFKVGQNVNVSTFNGDGVILALNDDKKQATVQMGAIKTDVPYYALKIKKSNNKNTGFTVKKVKRAADEHIKMELDLRGEDSETARMETEKYLDDAYMNGLTQVTIIHGIGTLILKNMIKSLLKNYPNVKSYRDGKYGEGGAGVTVVEFK